MYSGRNKIAVYQNHQRNVTNKRLISEMAVIPAELSSVDDSDDAMAERKHVLTRHDQLGVEFDTAANHARKYESARPRDARTTLTDHVLCL